VGTAGLTNGIVIGDGSHILTDVHIKDCIAVGSTPNTMQGPWISICEHTGVVLTNVRAGLCRPPLM
jgi:hypothetical protein